MSAPDVNAKQKWKMPRPEGAQHTADPHIMGLYSFYKLQLNFCTRLNAADHNDVSDAKDGIGGWPVGTYCIINAGMSCPKGN